MLRKEGVETFEAYCGSAADMSMHSFAKLCKDLRLTGRRMAPGDVDLVFAKVAREQGGAGALRRMNLRMFEEALRVLADKLDMDVCDICETIEEHGGPTLHSTKAEAVRFHDDKTTYTGTHMHGGPEAGRKGAGSADMSVWLATLRPERRGSVTSECSTSTPRDEVEELYFTPSDCVRRKTVRQACCSLEDIFQKYSGNRAKGMDMQSFAKLCRDASLIGKDLSIADADLIFASVVPKGHRRLEMVWFPHALWHVAERKGIDVEAVVAAVVAITTGPSRNATLVDDVRLHDDKDTYTGTHAQGGPDVKPTVRVSMDDVWRTGLRSDN
mmetsp:Transcript_45941/g.109395  ORF Transcript_45941/g.109395 Transcript_45941/m.109395 type:complete len:327 (+) Transcript_45941:97-1077(+)